MTVAVRYDAIVLAGGRGSRLGGVDKAGLVLAGPARAQDAQVVLAIAQSVDEVLNNVRNWIVGILASLATVFLTIGGARYTMAGGDPGEVERAREALRAAAKGYALAALAPLVVEILKGIVGA